MTLYQIVLIQKSWKILRNVDHLLIGDVFYSKLFMEEPRLEHLFRHSMKDQAGKFVDMVGFIVSHLDNLQELAGDIRHLALRHQQYGVKHANYDAVGKAFLWTLRHGLGSDWNEEVQEAWTTCYQVLSTTMKQAVSQ